MTEQHSSPVDAGEDALFEAMLDGWARQQRGAGRSQPSTIDFREHVVRRFARFAGAPPWQWSPEHVDKWISHLTGELRRAQSTVRSYQAALRLFCDYVAAPHSGWRAQCEARFGRAPEQVCPDADADGRLAGYHGDPGRRPMTREEVQRFLDYADDQVEAALRQGHKGALARYRDATLFKVVYAWGLRGSEASALDVTDFHPHPEAPDLGRFGSLYIRSGRRVRDLPPRRRTVVSVMPWAVEAVKDYLAEVRPRYRSSLRPAMWPTERGGRVRTREIEDRFAAYRDALGLDRALTPHCMRSAYMAHLLADGASLAFVQEQVGHRFAVTTANCVRPLNDRRGPR
ncbi:tyrosine-type recombinase/integrase [Nonomuraea sp. SYSU D8015]|uniref:tyrosine-type recombinase/integrase n=1 Tax=Nonomuraea sp. SYSU D8015 TaxID=2593644 RepID=UPI001660D41D|nr:tyrosine-type recombinase/integrase [Nonomuraea sp. SYSU D8015]